MPLYDLKRGLLVNSVAFSIFFGGCLSVATVTVSAEEQTKEQENRFDLFELRVKGNTLLERTQLERTVYPFLGPQKTIATVEKAREALEKIYHDQGYQTVGVDIPEQDVQNGVVYLQVVEGKVSRLRVKDSRYFSLGSIKAAVPELAEGHIPNMPKMQEQLAALDKLSNDRKITPILRPGDTPGTLDVDLKVKDDLPLHGSVALNGRNTSSTSLLRLVSTVHYDNLWQKYHSASLTYQVSPEESDEVDVVVGTYSLPLFDNAAKLALYGVSSSSNAQIASGGALAVIGNGQIFGARLIKPLPTIKNYSQSMLAGVDYKSFKEDLQLIGADTIRTPISYLPFTLQYNGSVKNEKSLVSFNLGANFSVRGLGNSQAEFENKRLYAQANYLDLIGGLNFTQQLPLGMEFFSRLSGQLADSPLISNEQFSMGGMQSIRGYYETQALMDSGIVGSMEWRSPRLVSAKLDYINKLQALVFLDGGKGWSQRVLAGNASTNELASTGIGTRIQMFKHFIGVLDIGFPLIDLKPVYMGDPKVHFNIATEF
ncbi:ShlB/FhaC/HecB family hemolysin secretion/activation protein [Methylovulum psychrotolerans]|uniref:ShlB/FhaC/HecB family hemolysin secretion/activation protein n=1 Tax=Methylovulum psychrotolerans TaxID=1704499 RepID=A0A2S5CRS4_9GAMM|nr:ShlB/FhaC/HecB family hemolysin secretion/activation protein [Methylovulum psychrotolerans]